MAKEDEKKPTAADKGKGKAPANNDADKSKDAKPDLDDKKGGVATTGEELSEEDQQLKSDLDMLAGGYWDPTPASTSPRSNRSRNSSRHRRVP